jgi:hypothetical protein
MPKQVLTDAFIEISGTDLSNYVSSVTVNDSADDVDLTGFGPSGYREHGQGLKDAQVDLDFFQNYDRASVDAVLFPLYASGGTFGVVVRPTSSPASETNPRYSMTGRLFTYSPLDGGVGDANTTRVTIMNAGTAGLTRGTA